MDSEPVILRTVPVSAATDDTCHAITDEMAVEKGRSLADQPCNEIEGNVPLLTRDDKKKERNDAECYCVSASVERVAEILNRSIDQFHDFLQEKLSFQREKMYWELAQSLLGPGSTANYEERNKISSLMRKRLMNNLSRDDTEPMTKVSRRTGEENVCGAVNGVFANSHHTESVADQAIFEDSNA